MKIHKHVAGNETKRKAIYSIILVARWSLWRARNNYIFSNLQIKIENIMAEVKSVSFCWMKNRSKGWT
ncbi:hypothetical protein HanPI659440_Chr12g0451781 [Helianthus annuus]|nr:hypothetical protein HanPI659440_Chr12g0451781 [Helianthus annuus]